jgi:hypothetical protein
MKRSQPKSLFAGPRHPGDAKKNSSFDPDRNKASEAPAMNKGSIAQLSLQEIADMSREGLVGVIRAAELPFMRQTGLDKISKLDRPTLQRLVYMTRHCCRNQGY